MHAAASHLQEVECAMCLPHSLTLSQLLQLLAITPREINASRVHVAAATTIAKHGGAAHKYLFCSATKADLPGCRGWGACA
jgi:hypothetical protein